MTYCNIIWNKLFGNKFLEWMSSFLNPQNPYQSFHYNVQNKFKLPLQQLQIHRLIGDEQSYNLD